MIDAHPDMDELLNRARELLALRDKATPGPWESPRENFGIYDANDESVVNNAARNFPFIAAAHDMADTIRDLLAELQSLLDDWMREQAERSEAQRRAEAAESRLRELASADPVAVVDREAVGRVFWLSIIPDGTLLIRRPEMPS